MSRKVVNATHRARLPREIKENKTRHINTNKDAFMAKLKKRKYDDIYYYIAVVQKKIEAS